MKPTKKQLAKLIKALEAMDANMAQCKDLTIHSQISQFYYLQKAEELKIIINQVDECSQRLEVVSDLMAAQYSEIFCRWRQEVRQLRKLLKE